MIRLIKAELKKLVHKKSFLIITVIFIAFCFLTNIIYKENYEDVINNVNIKELESYAQSLDTKNSEELLLYVKTKTDIEVEKLKKKYDYKRNYIIDSFITDIIMERNKAEFVLKDLNLKKDLETKLNNYLERLEKKDWNFFTTKKLEELNNLLNDAQGKAARDTYLSLIKIFQYRMNNRIEYSKDDYIHVALNELEIYLPDYFTLKNKGTLNKEEKEYYQEMKNTIATNEYIIKNKKDINDNNSLVNVLHNFPSDFGLFILIYIIMISGSIVSEEFSKGTIKYLLTKPYRRRTILASKLITILLLIPIIIISMFIIDFIIGGFLLGFDTLNIPLLYITETGILTRNIFTEFLLVMLSILPSYLILCVICFMISTLTCSTSAAITITFLFYLIGNVISNLALTFNFKILKYFISLHWDFSYLVYHESNPYKFSPSMSIIVNLVYLVAILCITFIYFDKKDVKNI